MNSYQYSEKIMTTKYEPEEIHYVSSHISTLGKDANLMKNPIWKIQENEKEYLLMYCEKDTICKLCPVSHQKILDYELNENNGKKNHMV